MQQYLLHLKTRFLAAVEDIRSKEDQLALALSLIIGAVVGLAVVAFILLTGRLTARMYPPTGEAWRRMAGPVLGSLISGFLLVKYFPHARGSGIPQTRAAIFVNNGRISLRTVVGKFVCCVISLGSGISLGREGPSVQIGSGIASVFAQRLGLGREQVKWLVPVGASAALAAAFNTPIAAVLFSLEEIMGDLHTPILGSVVLSSATSWIVLHLLLGDNPLFRVPPYQLVNPTELLIYALLGIVGGFVSVAFVKLLLSLRAAFKKLPSRTLWIQPVVGGLVVGAMAYFVPQVLGVGYGEVEKVLGGHVVLYVVVLLLAMKLVATAVCYASGNAGGIFGPSLFLGAMVGGAVGTVAHMVAPSITAGAGAYALVGMGATFAGVVRTPLTSVIMVFEITRDYSIIVPLMISNLLAFYISRKFQHQPIYEALARQDDLHLPQHAGETRASIRPVSLAIRESPEPLGEDDKVGEIVQRVADTSLTSWPVANEEGLVGMVRVADLESVAAGEPTRKVGELITGDDEVRRLVHVHLDQPLSVALERMGESGHHVLPVVSRGNGRLLLGLVTLNEVLRVYGVAHARADA